MTTDSRVILFTHTSDAEFRTWAAAIIDQFNDIGLTQTGDTGQIDTTTVLRPAINTQAGYAIFRFNDAVQSDGPIYIRLGFGTGSVATTPQLTVTVGKSTDGAGTISGILYVATARNWNPSAVAGVSSYACYDEVTGTLWAVWASNSFATNQVLTLIIARTADVDTGEPHAGGILVNWTAAVGSFQLASMHTTTSYVEKGTIAIIYAPSTYPGNYYQDGLPIAWIANGYVPSADPSRPEEAGFCIFPGLYGCLVTDFPPAEQIVVDLIGVDHTYLALTFAGGIPEQFDALSNSTAKLLMIWE